MSDLATDAASINRQAVSTALDSTALAAMISAVLAISWSPILIRFSDVAPAATAFWRLTFSLPLLILWVRADSSRPGVASWNKAGMLAAICAGLAFAADLAFYHAALPLTSIANASFISNLAPVASVAAGFVVLRDRVRPLVLGALLIAIAGVVVTSGAYRSGLAMGRGDVLATGSALSYAFYLVALRVARGGHTAASVTLISTAVAGLALLAVALLEGGTFWPQSTRGWAVVIALGVICQVLGQGLSAVGIGRLPAGIVALILLSHPIISAIIAYFIFGEALSLDQFAGGAMILGAVILARFNSK